MRRAIVLIGCTLVGALPALSQTPQSVAEGVAVLSASAGPGPADRNAGWVELDDYLIVIDGGPGDGTPTVGDIAARSTGKPVRFVTRTLGGPVGVAAGGAEGLTWLAAADDITSASRSTNTTDFGGAPDPLPASVLRVPSGTMLEASGRGVELHHIAERAGGALAIYVADTGTLFAGDLVGPGRGSHALSVHAWIKALNRLERLNVQVVVPGQGRLEGPEVLRTTRIALERLKGHVSGAIAAGSGRDQVMRAAGSDDFEVLPDGTVGEVYDELVGLRPATAFVEGLGLREGPSPTAAGPGWTRPTKVVVADFWPGRTQQLALVAPGVEVVVAATPSEAAEVGRDADAILGWLTPEIFNDAPNLRWVQLNAAGVESYVTIPGFAESDVVLSNAQRIFGPGGAEHVLGMVLALSRRLHVALELQQERRWDHHTPHRPDALHGSG